MKSEWSDVLFIGGFMALIYIAGFATHVALREFYPPPPVYQGRTKDCQCGQICPCCDCKDKK